ncbi:hypothetical protein VIBNISFn27_510051 [Vibrio nigripulchritudo SFn27]|nr:hypothetical protein VIBNISFn27_510051 [Vibrio nigripulchritudo SFn27]CCN96725.1 hypothetical protein VIBNIENn2_790051 [Vibrio nigripulchritudo ENn2]
MRSKHCTNRTDAQPNQIRRSDHLQRHKPLCRLQQNGGNSDGRKRRMNKQTTANPEAGKKTMLAPCPCGVSDHQCSV